jgi:hypothetical protein
VRTTILLGIALAVAAALLVACGGGSRGLDRRPSATISGDNGYPTGRVVQTMQPQTNPHPPKYVIVFRRVRYEGATLRTLYLHRDGRIDVEVPGGGAGGSRYDGRVTKATLRSVQRLVRRTPWDHLSRRRVPLEPIAGSGAYFMLRHAGKDHIAMADGMSPDLVPVVNRLNGILNGDGERSRRVLHRFNIG